MIRVLYFRTVIVDAYPIEELVYRQLRRNDFRIMGVENTVSGTENYVKVTVQYGV